MDDLLEQMSILADQAGDWRPHLPYAAAVGFLEDEKYQQQHGAHVDGCQYCQQLIDALRPSEDTMAKLLSRVAELSLGSEVRVDFADAVAEARWNLDSLRDVVLAQSHGDHPGALRAWANAQQHLVHASQSLDDLNGGALVPWTATVALSLDTQPNVTPLEFDRKVNGLATAVKTWHSPVSFLAKPGISTWLGTRPLRNSISVLPVDLKPI